MKEITIHKGFYTETTVFKDGKDVVCTLYSGGRKTDSILLSVEELEKMIEVARNVH